MRAWTYALLALGVLTLPACGDKAGGRGEALVVGRWTLDYTPLLDSQLEMALADARKSLAAVPPEQLEAARSLQPSTAALQEIRKELETTLSVLEIRADATYTHTTTGPGPTEVGGGTWHQVGHRVTLLPRSLNHEPVQGRLAAPVMLTFEGGVLSMQPSPKMPRLKFRRAPN